MNWKCVLVGLALVFPGTLVSVEGRYFTEEERAVSEADGFYDRLYNLLRRPKLEEKYKQPHDGAPRVNGERDTKLTNDDSHLREGVQKFKKDKATGGKVDSVEMPAAAAGRGPNEINKAVNSPLGHHQSQKTETPVSTTAFMLVVAGCTVLAAVGIVGAGVCWYKYHKSAKAASVVDYPAYGVTGPTKDRVPSPGDRKLAHSAQMYHYQHQKQQMMALQSASSGEMKHDGSDDESVEENDDADYTVYECPGLAPTGEMEVKNPLFCGDETPSTPANDDTRPTPPEY